MGFKASNNEAEYEAFLVGLRTVYAWAHGMWRFILILGWLCIRSREALKLGILK